MTAPKHTRKRDAGTQGRKPAWFLAWIAAAIVLLLAPREAGGFIHPAGDELPNFDKRSRGDAARAKAAEPVHRAAVGHLNEQVPDAKIDLDDILGTSRWVRSERGTLSGPNGRGRGVPARAAAEFGANDPHRAAKAFLKEHRALFGHGPEALAGAKIQREFVTAHSGLKTVVWEQQLDNIAVFEGLLIAHTTRNDELVSLSSRFHPNPEQAANTGGRNRAAFVADPGISAKQAIVIAARSVQEEVALYGVSALDGQPVGAEKTQRFKARGLPGEARARLVWLPMDAKELRLCWEVWVTRRARGELYRVLIDARTGEALLRHCLTAYLADASYRVWTSDSPTPLSPGWPAPNTNQPPLMPRVLVTTNALNTNASPAGWINDGDNETRGNNVDAHLDRDGDNAPDLPRPHGSPNRVFDFKIDLTEAPPMYGNAAVVQLFYWCNWMHDKLYDLGFTEAAGNFQVDNFGRGGADGDPVMADAQDGSGTDNANFATAPDGNSPRMQMFLFSGPNPNRDGDLDGEVILHEYTHGLSNRRVGGGVGISALQSRGMGEGWSDFYSLALLSGPGDDLNGTYAEGAYVSFLLGGVRENYYFGIRRYPYTTDMAKNPLTFKDIDPTQASAHPSVPRSVLGGPADEVHSQGEVWCVTLWEARARLIQRYGWEIGNRLILQLLTDGMNLTPANPNFIEARDAILQADLVANGSANFNDLWSAFARRGLGTGATAPASSTTLGVVEAFDVPDDLVIRPATGFIAVGPEGGPFAPNAQTFTLTNIGTNTITWTAEQTNTWLNISVHEGTLVPGAAMGVTASIAPSAGNLAAGIYSDTVQFSNQVSHAAQTRSFVLRVGQPDFFTELFDVADNDLAFHSLLFTPNGSQSFYAACRQAVTNFPTDPAGGTLLALSDDSSVQITLADTNTVGVYGRRTNTFFIGSNGYLTFDLGDSSYTENFEDHFSLPRVAALYDDLNPGAGGTISWKQLSNRVAVTWQNVPQYGTADANSFQIELFYDGAVRITWLALGARDGLAGLSAGNGIPAGFLESDLSSYGQCADPLLVILPSSAVESAGVLAGQGDVHITTPVATNVIVNLFSSDLTEATVPANVTILAGETNATYDITIQDDTSLDGPQIVVITATAPGFGSGAATMTVLDDETATLHLILPASTTEGMGSVTGLVQVSRAPDIDVLVQLASSDTNELRVPLGVVVSAGQTSAVFIASVVDDTLIDGPQTVTITASVPAWPTEAATLTVLDNETLDLTVVLPARAAEGQGTTSNAGQVLLSGRLLTNLVVSLVSDDLTELIVPGTVTVPAGQLAGTFNLTIVDDALVDGTQIATVTASATGFGTGSASMVILDNESPPEPSTPDPRHLASNVVVTTDLSWRSDGNEAINNGGFESGDFSGWQRHDVGSGAWLINNGTYVPASSDRTNAPFLGRFSAVSDQSGPGRHELYQEVSVPDSAGTVTLHWADCVRNFGGEFATNQYFRVEIRDLSDAVLAIAYATQSGDALLTNWLERSFDLTQFRGQTVRVIFIEEDNLGYFNVHLDNVGIEANSGVITSDVYFGTNTNPGPSELLGSTTNTTWDLPTLAPLTTYYWRIVARRGGVTSGPIWQFTTRGVDHFTLSAVPAPQFVNQPFALTITAKDAFDTTVTNYMGFVRLAGFTNDNGLSMTFSDGFEDGTFAGWTIGSGAYDREVTTATAAGGTHSFTLTGGSQNHYDGISRALPGLRPDVVNFHVRASSVSRAGGYVVLSDGTSSLANVLALFYMAETEGGMGLYEDTHGRHLIPYQAEQWYKITLRLHWETRSIDYLVDDSVMETNIPFRGADVASITRLDLYNYDNMQAWWDEFEFLQGGAPLPVSISPNNSGAFNNGTWSGPVTVFEPATNLFLVADDGSGHRATGNAFSVFVQNDLAVSMSAAPDPVDVGVTLTYSIAVFNSGPATATGVALSNEMPAGVNFVSASASQGACTNIPGILSCDLGDVDGGTIAAVTLVVRPNTTGLLTNTVSVSRPGIEPFFGNNTASAVTLVTAPNLSIDDAIISEGDSGTTNAVFNVRLSRAAAQTVSVSFVSFDNTATAMLDYVQTNGLLIFTPGETNKQISVTVLGDTLFEADESFYVQIFSATNAIISDPLGFGIIRNDDPDPASVRILSLVVTNGLAALQWESVSGATYRLEYKTDLPSTNWIFAGNMTATAATAGMTNQVGADAQRFYRLVRP